LSNRRSAGEAARRGVADARVIALVEAGVLVPLAGVGAFAGLILWGIKCDGSCEEGALPEYRTGEWWHTQDAWQWPTQFLVAAAGFGLICTAFVWASTKHYRRASIAMTLAAACFGAWAAFLAPLGNGLGI
jgi:hypothetical protein